MNTPALVALIAAFVVIAAITMGAIEALLPGGRWNPYHAENVEKRHTAVRVAAYVAAILVALGLAVHAS
jgi:hypothetical protein